MLSWVTQEGCWFPAQGEGEETTASQGSWGWSRPVSWLGRPHPSPCTALPPADPGVWVIGSCLPSGPPSPRAGPAGRAGCSTCWSSGPLVVFRLLPLSSLVDSLCPGPCSCLRKTGCPPKPVPAPQAAVAEPLVGPQDPEAERWPQAPGPLSSGGHVSLSFSVPVHGDNCPSVTCHH